MEIIKSIQNENSEIIKSILKLHCNGQNIQCDATYSKGVFYKNNGIEKPKYKFDLFPQTSDTVQADCRNLPLQDNSIGVLMFDPPFVISKGPSMNARKDGQNIISNRFSYFENPKLLYDFYKESINEFYRVLEPNGILIFKCQDTVSSGTNYFSHCYIHNYAVSKGFYPKDLFVLNAKQRIISGKHKNQQHARKYHSYYWVFVKDDKKLNKANKFLQLTPPTEKGGVE